MRIYKRNLGIINGRYGELERRIFEKTHSSGERIHIVGAGGDLMCANAVKDGLLSHQPELSTIRLINVQYYDQPPRDFPIVFGYLVTDEGMEFIRKYCSGEDIG